MSDMKYKVYWAGDTGFVGTLEQCVAMVKLAEDMAFCDEHFNPTPGIYTGVLVSRQHELVIKPVAEPVMSQECYQLLRDVALHDAPIVEVSDV